MNYRDHKSSSSVETVIDTSKEPEIALQTQTTGESNEQTGKKKKNNNNNNNNKGKGKANEKSSETDGSNVSGGIQSTEREKTLEITGNPSIREHFDRRTTTYNAIAKHRHPTTHPSHD